MINLELFCCAGGMAEGFRRAGIHFDVAVDFAPDHCDSYERNIGHRPLCMDARQLLADVVAGEIRWDVDLLVADPPCTPWSRAGKRLGTEDERDMLGVTCALIAALRPRRYLIGNVPGLDDSTNLHVVQRHIGALARFGYCCRDFARLDAADYGVPQHRIRPWWFGHREGPCIAWPAPTHADPLSLATLPLPGIEPMRPWVTCREALGHLSPEELGRPVKMRKRAQNGHQHGSVPDRPARVVGTSNLSDGSCITVTSKHRALNPDEPSTTVTGGGDLGHSAQHHPPSYGDEPAMTVRAGCGAGARRAVQLDGRKKRPPSTQGPQSTRTISPDAPATTVQAREDRVGSGSPVLEWPWPRPSTTVQADERIAKPGHHGDPFMSDADAVILSERAAAILQGFPEDWVFCGKTKKARWSQIGQAMPPALAEAVARAVTRQDGNQFGHQFDSAPDSSSVNPTDERRTTSASCDDDGREKMSIDRR